MCHLPLSKRDGLLLSIRFGVVAMQFQWTFFSVASFLFTCGDRVVAFVAQLRVCSVATSKGVLANLIAS